MFKTKKLLNRKEDTQSDAGMKEMNTGDEMNMEFNELCVVVDV